MSMTTSELASERASERDDSLALVADSLGGDAEDRYEADELADDDSETGLFQSDLTVAELQEQARETIRRYLAQQGDVAEDELEYPTAAEVGRRFNRGRSWGRDRVDEVKVERRARADAEAVARAALQAAAAAEAAAQKEPVDEEIAPEPVEMPRLERLLAANGPIDALRRETFGYTRDIALLAAEVSTLVQEMDFNSERLERREQALVDLEKRLAAEQRARELDSERASKRRQRQERRRQQIADDAHLIVNTQMTRFVAWLAFALGAIASIAANVLHAVTVGGAGGVARLIYSGLWPVALLLAVEVLTRARVPRRGMYSIARYGATLVVAFVAAAVSYRHMVGLLAHWGEDAFNAHVGPLAVDGLMVVAGVALLGISQGRVMKKKQLDDELAELAARELESERA